MGKETELIKAVKHNDQPKLQKLLVPETPTYNIRRISREDPKLPKSPSSPGGRIRMQLDHININCTEKETGYTPLIIAILNENKDVTDTLIFHCADVNIADHKGNTPLHYAVFAGRAELVEILLQNGSQVNKQNSDGNTPLHVACQSEKERRVMIMLKLLKYSANVFLKNKNNSTALDVAAMYGKKDAVSVLLDHDSSLSSNTSAIIEAALRGYTEVVHLLLDYGVNANCINDIKETGPLHEATRFLRYEAAENLIEYGASPLLQNPKSETPLKIAEALPPNLNTKFLELFKDRSKRESHTPRFRNGGILYSPTKHITDYPLLPSRTEWTQNSTSFCNSCTAEHPNTNIFDGNLQTFWVIESSEYVWTVLDLQTEHTLTGITIYGWDSKQMVKRFELQKGPTVQGPWTTVGCFVCKRIGSKNPKDNGVPQTFKDFTASSRYWRYHLLENHGGSCTCFQGLGLHGADDRILTYFEELDMINYAEQFIIQGYNTHTKLLLIYEDDLKKIISDVDHQRIVKAELEKEARKDFKLKSLKWKHLPPCAVKQSVIFPDIVVKGDPGCREKLKLCFEDVNSERQMKEEFETYLETLDENQQSLATFSGVAIPNEGKYRCLVKSVEHPDVVLVAPAEIDIQPSSNLSTEMQDAFSDMEQMLVDLQTNM
ncbi:uncharacterized protein LOC127698798 [Mytilus californianus]|uniref:uncharacterized protein LOC127698798 n=1 Tax=Mytilus californianus TaxID=6549 RepID=UPI0022482EE4|nr:uncharacterized protein LOC127698798 [Mytilus californianus]